MQWIYSITLRNTVIVCLVVISEIAMLNVPKRRMVMASLSNLAEFLGVYDGWRRMVHRFGIKWVTSDVTDRRIIDRLTKVSDPGEIYEWVKAVKKARPDLKDFLDFMAITGLRLVEAITIMKRRKHLSISDMKNCF